MASSRSLLTGEEEGDNDSALRSVSVDSNQNKQVIYFHLVLYHAKSDLRIYLGCKLGQTATAIIDRGGDLEIRVDHVARATFSEVVLRGPDYLSCWQLPDSVAEYEQAVHKPLFAVSKLKQEAGCVWNTVLIAHLPQHMPLRSCSPKPPLQSMHHLDGQRSHYTAMDMW